MTARIVVGADGSANSNAALRWAVGEARRIGATVEAVLGWNEPVTGGVAPVVVDPGVFEESFRSELDKITEAFRAEAPDVTIEPVLVHGSPAHVLLDRAEGAELLVVGSRGHGGFMGLLLGSVSQQVVWHAPCPVVVVPPPDR